MQSLSSMSFEDFSENDYKVQKRYYKNFYVLRFKISIDDHLVEFDGELKDLVCDKSTAEVRVPFSSLLQDLRPLLAQYGVSSILSPFADPLPLLAVSFNRPENIRYFLLHVDDVSLRVWLLFRNAFTTTEPTYFELKKEHANAENMLQDMSRPGNKCQLQLLCICPNSYKDVLAVPTTLANYETVIKVMENSFIFDFQSTMSALNYEKSHAAVKEYTSISDLQCELESVPSWFLMGIAAKMPFSTLTSILENFRHRGACQSQMLSHWYSHSTDVTGENQLTWTKVAKLMITIGKRSVANYLMRRYGLSNNSFEPLITETNSAHGRLLSDPFIRESIQSLSSNEEEIIEKTKLLIAYEQQQKILEISLEDVTKELLTILDDVRYAFRMNENAKNKISNVEKSVKALERALQPFNETTATPQSSDWDTKLQLEEILQDYEYSKMNQLADVELVSTRLSLLLPQLKKTYRRSIKENDLLASKNHQIFQLKCVIHLKRTECLKYELMADHFLQEQVASKTMPGLKVLQIQKGILEVEMAEKKSQLADVLKELKESSERSIERQKELEKVTTAISQWMIDQEITEDQNMSEIFQQIEKIPELQSALLELKKNVWKLEETQQITTAESKVLQQLLESVKHAERKQKQKHDNDTKSLLSVTETTDTTFVPRECELLLSQVIQIDIHNPVKLVIKVDDKLKINPKKNSYISEIKSLADNSCVAKPLIFDSSTSRLSTVFKPVMRGRHQFHIKASNNKPIKGIKPFEFFVKQSPDTLGHPVRVIEGLNYPYNVHVVPNSSTMLVSECKSHCVTIMDKNTGKRLNTIGGLTGVIKIPNGIATDLQGFVYVVDSGNHCVHTFTLEGTPIDKQGNKGNAHTDFHYPYGIGISPHNGTINICDHNNDRVKIFSHDMKFQKMIHAVTPYDIAFDKKGHTYVTDNSNHLVAVFNEQFHCINSISGKGTEVGKLLEPRGIAIDNEDHIYVVEELNCRVSIFNTRGELITYFGQEGNQPGQFNSPQGIHVDDDSYIYICDMLNNRVQVF